MQKIATEVIHDADLKSLTLCATTFADQICDDSSEVWRKRFLAVYDQPFVDTVSEFAIAYKLRRFVLRNFKAMDVENKERATRKRKVMSSLMPPLLRLLRIYACIQRHGAIRISNCFRLGCCE